MLRNHAYYLIKPFLPWRVRNSIRRLTAKRKRSLNRSVWPIDPYASCPPLGWTGWPNNKQFAFVLTHDVEGPEGVSKCKKLAELEMEMGFRSSFNFIPEGSYPVPTELLDWLKSNDFEIGVHDLNHDGRLLRSRKSFKAKAERINYYLGQWGAVGFRAGFMLRNLEWFHDLNIEYDASTFDTDPFEPMPDGIRTIFPFWKPIQENCSINIRPRHVGYVELPYTLPQDSTLFFLLQERSAQIWLQKADWVISKNGMVLVNVHPDYIAFTPDEATCKTFPVNHYRTLLQHLRDRYHDRYWHANPCAVARFVASQQPRPQYCHPRRIAMVTHSYYETDNRVTRYAEALADRGDRVEVFALRRSRDLPLREEIRGVQLHRLHDRLGKNEKSKWDYAWSPLLFLFKVAWHLAREHRREPFTVLHVHNVPDFLVFAAAWPRFRGAKVILDIHDILPEFFASKFDADPRSLPVRLLRWMELRSARAADHIILSNHLWQEKYVARTGVNGKSSVFINHVDERVFRISQRRRQDEKLVVIFPGGLQWHQGMDIALKAFQRVVARLPNAELHIYGEGNMKASLISLRDELGLASQVHFFEPRRIHEIAAIMAEADLGIVPKRADSFGNEAYSTKIMEFMSLGVPVVVADTKIDRYYFHDDVVRFFPSGDAAAMAEAMIDLLSQPAKRARLAESGLAYAQCHNWGNRKADYLTIVDSL